MKETIKKTRATSITVLLAAIVIAGGIYAWARSAQNTIPTHTTTTYTSENGLYKLQLPLDWVEHSTYDGSPVTITHLKDNGAVYGPRNEPNQVWIESFTTENVAKSSRTFYEVALKIRISPEYYPLTNKRTEGAVTIYEHTANTGLDNDIKHYFVFEKKNILVILGFSKDDKQTQDILESLEFLQ